MILRLPVRKKDLILKVEQHIKKLQRLKLLQKSNLVFLKWRLGTILLFLKVIILKVVFIFVNFALVFMSLNNNLKGICTIVNYYILLGIKSIVTIRKISQYLKQMERKNGFIVKTLVTYQKCFQIINCFIIRQNHFYFTFYVRKMNMVFILLDIFQKINNSQIPITYPVFQFFLVFKEKVMVNF